VFADHLSNCYRLSFVILCMNLHLCPDEAKNYLHRANFISCYPFGLSSIRSVITSSLRLLFRHPACVLSVMKEKKKTVCRVGSHKQLMQNSDTYSANCQRCFRLDVGRMPVLLERPLCGISRLVSKDAASSA
jgi:hypothetical protein